MHRLSLDKVIFLGTGCAIPSKYRNVTSIFFKVKWLNEACIDLPNLVIHVYSQMKTGSILFDAGIFIKCYLVNMNLIGV